LDLSLEGKVAVVTGGNRGIGEAIVGSFSGQGCKVVVASRTGGVRKSRTSGERGSVFHVKADVSVEGDVRRLVKATLSRFGALDVLVNNVGPTGPVKRIEDCSLGEWNATIAGGLTSAFLCSREVVSIMKRRRSGRIINISSMVGKRPTAFRSPYAAAKMGLIGFTRSLAAELAAYEITVNAICPASVEGERMNYLTKQYAKLRKTTYNRVREQMISGTLGERFLTVDEVADVVLFLASGAARGITGREIDVTC